MTSKLVFLSVMTSVLADDFCYFYTNNGKLNLDFCAYGCCHEYRYGDPCCGLSGGIIAGIAIAIIILVALIALAVIFARRRYLQRTSVQYNMDNSPTPQVVASQTITTATDYNQPPPYGTLAYTATFIQPPSYDLHNPPKSPDETKPTIVPNEQPPPYSERASDQTTSQVSH